MNKPVNQFVSLLLSAFLIADPVSGSAALSLAANSHHIPQPVNAYFEREALAGEAQMVQHVIGDAHVRGQINQTLASQSPSGDISAAPAITPDEPTDEHAQIIMSAQSNGFFVPRGIPSPIFNAYWRFLP